MTIGSTDERFRKIAGRNAVFLSEGVIGDWLDCGQNFEGLVSRVTGESAGGGVGVEVYRAAPMIGQLMGGGVGDLTEGGRELVMSLVDWEKGVGKGGGDKSVPQKNVGTKKME
jgi:hypothetical protein